MASFGCYTFLIKRIKTSTSCTNDLENKKKMWCISIPIALQPSSLKVKKWVAFYADVPKAYRPPYSLPHDKPQVLTSSQIFFRPALPLSQ